MFVYLKCTNMSSGGSTSVICIVSFLPNVEMGVKSGRKTGVAPLRTRSVVIQKSKI